MRVAIIVPFLNEEELLPQFLASVAGQQRHPDLLLLIDDGSTDHSPQIAADFCAAHDFARVLARPPRAAERDRLATAAELQAFHWGRESLDEAFDVIAKMDADLRLSADHVQEVLAALENDASLGVCGAYLSVIIDGEHRREAHAATHVRGPSKFYRAACLEQIEPLPEILGWDAFDTIRARMYGWSTLSVELPLGDSIHLRPTGLHDGRLRAFRRWGRCAWGYGAHPLIVILGTATRMLRKPRIIGGISYLFGYLHAAATRAPRVDAETRRAGRKQQLQELRERVVK
jgi:poly-beta-1,6-N-acetyl-D-glucosamine synthase